MEYIIIIILVLIICIILSILYEYNLKKLEKFVKNEEKTLNQYIEKYPSNMAVCKSILKKLNNENVIIEEDKNAKTCLYVAITDKIIIADIKNSYTRIQTICHECIHSIQDRKILLFNFIFSNIYLLYFIIVTVLALLKIIQFKMMFMCIMLIFSYVYYFIRSYLENDAMIKAKFLAKEYFEETNILNVNEINNIIKSYEKLNNNGIKMSNLQLFYETIYKVIILSIIFLIR